MKFWLSRPDLRRYSGLVQRPRTTETGVTAWFLGTSSVLLSDGRTAVLTDGFVTRPGLVRVAFGRIAPDRNLVRQAVERLGTPPIAAVVCVHSHYDHALDAPVWASLTGAELVGSESTANIGRGLGVPEQGLRVVGDGDVRTFGEFGLTFVESEHSPGDHYPGTVDAPLVPPRRSREWRTGSVYSVFVSHPRGTVLLHASAGFRPGALHGRHADVVYLGVGTLGKQPVEYVEAYWDEVVLATGARRVVLVHWDDFFRSLDEPLRPMSYLADDLDVTLSCLSALAERDDRELLLPVAWQPADPFAPSRG
ncbi:L-ascorbate metabolism protein UlaG, beta-lactamase superfamily [Lentzea waywayandensis]|uniref:L-ascorbate metabolism protein UlaG, beta-lactamase superfamily n=1 Tax=Lentzea waywayandensis TaxID=84724 RepID=A0A1I6D9J0_9PSEU|nr:MBL fold metallo-hydrolase [Lentzea waywayandensis]SFR02103.1 L-ascorbate metabolism protein UlaG, beta-lactamase superfamily [Lentzea waywayandensis]